MASVYDLKPAFQNLLRPIVKSMAEHRILPNHVTILAIIISVITGLLITLNLNSGWPLLVLPVVLFIRMALNAIDGMLAREFNMKTNAGAILNELGDVLSDVALYFPFSLMQGINSHLINFIIFFLIISEMAGLIGIQFGASRRYDGPMGKSDRAAVFSLLALAIYFWGIGDYIINIVLCIVLILLVITTFNRSRMAVKEASDEN